MSFRVNRQLDLTLQNARTDTAHYIGMLYNPKRPHNTYGGVSPVEFEKRQPQQLGSV